MTNKRRCIWTVAIGLVTALFLSVYNNFILQAQSGLVIDQVNGGDLEFGIARLASRDYSGYVVALMIVWVFLLWAPVVWRKFRPDG